MDKVSMLQRLRVLLDESVQSFWQDTDCYAALTDGQETYTEIILALFKSRSLSSPSEPIPEVLRPLYRKDSDILAGNFIALPADYLYDLSFSLGGTYNRPLLKRLLSRTAVFDQANTYLGTQGYYYYIINNQLNIEITGGAGTSYIFEYIAKPTAINASIDPVLPEFCHAAIVEYAFASLLRKAKLFKEADMQYQNFIQNIKYI